MAASLVSKPIVVFFLLSVSVMAWTYQGPYTIHFVDIQYPYDATYSFPSLGSAWNTINLGTYSGFNIFSLPATFPYLVADVLGVPAWFAQFSVNVVALWLSGYGMYLLIREFSSHEPSRIALFGSFAGGAFYMLNIVPAEVFYWDFIPIGPAFQAALPFQILLLVRCFRQLNLAGRLPWKNILASGALSVFTIGANEPLAMSAVLILVGFTAWGVVSSGPSWFRGVRLSFVLVAAVVIANAFWVFPEVALAAGAGSSAFLGPAAVLGSTNDYVTFTQRLTVLQAFELRGLQFNVLSWYYALYNSSSWFDLALLPLCLFQFLPLISLRRLTTNSRGPVLVAATLLLVSALLFTGYNAPGFLGGDSGVLASPTLVTFFRNTGNAFGPALSISEAVLIGFASILLLKWYHEGISRRVRTLVERASRSTARRPHPRIGKLPWILPALFLLVVIGPYVVPSVAGSLVASNPYESRTSIPPYVYDTANFVNSNAGNAYTLLVPGGFQEQNWTNYGGHGYDGYDILITLIHTPLIYGPGGGLGGPTNVAIEQAYSDLNLGGGDTNFSNLLAILDVKYVVLEGGVGGSYPWGVAVSDNISRMVSFLNLQPRVSEVASFGLNQIFVNDRPLPNSVFSAKNVMGFQYLSTNVTSEFYNSTTLLVGGASTPSIPPELGPGGEIIAQVTRQQQLAGLPPPGYPVLYNVAPLAIPVVSYPVLSISFQTGAFTAVQFAVSSTTTSQLDPLDGQWFSTWQFSSPSYNVVPNNGWYYSPNRTTTVQIDLGDLFAAETAPISPLFYLQYLSMQLWPTLGNDTIQSHTTPQNTRNLTLTIRSIDLESPIYSGGAPGTTIANSSLPSMNFTRTFEDAFVSNGSSSLPSPLQPTANGSGFSLSFNSSASNGPLPYPGFPSAFNRVPLAINTLAYPYLVVNLSTAPATGVLFRVSNASSITVANWTNEWVAPQIESPIVNNSLFSGQESFSVTIDLGDAFDPPTAGTHPLGRPILDYLFIQLVATPGNDGLVGVTIHSMELAAAVQIQANSTLYVSNLSTLIRIEPTVGVSFDPASDVFMSEASAESLTGLTATLAYNEVTSTEYDVSLSNVSSVVVVALLQNYNTEWQVTGLNHGSVVAHVTLDGYANGWIISPSPNVTELSFRLVFAGQTPLTIGMVVTGVGASVGLGWVMFAAVRNVRRRTTASRTQPNT